MTKNLNTQVRAESSPVVYSQMRIFFIVLLSIFLSSCSDSTKELSGNYFLREEGRDLNDISCHSATEREIPANIISYNFNDDFIIASQRPKMTDDPLYSETELLLLSFLRFYEQPRADYACAAVLDFATSSCAICDGTSA